MEMAWPLVFAVPVVLLFLGFRAGVYCCPECGKRFRMEPENVRFGFMPCPGCGTAVEVDH